MPLIGDNADENDHLELENSIQAPSGPFSQTKNKNEHKTLIGGGFVILEVKPCARSLVSAVLVVGSIRQTIIVSINKSATPFLLPSLQMNELCRMLR